MRQILYKLYYQYEWECMYVFIWQSNMLITNDYKFYCEIWIQVICIITCFYVNMYVCNCVASVKDAVNK